jgi:hypothetical protein
VLAALAFPACSPPSSPSDTTPPTLSSAEVKNAAPLTLVLTFSEDVRFAGDAPYGFTLSGTGSLTITAFSPSGQAAAEFSLTLSEAVTAGETLTLSYSSATSNVTDTSGNKLASFTGKSVTNNVSAADTTAPGITSSSPTNGATNIARPASISITFSKSIKLGTGGGEELANGSISWTNLSTSLPGFKFGTSSGGNDADNLVTGASYAAETNTLTLTLGTLAYNMHYYLTVGSISDLAGNSLTSTVIDFTTAEEGAKTVTLTLGAQSTTPTYGTAGAVAYSISTANIADAQTASAITWYTAASEGTTTDAPAGVTVSDGIDSVSVNDNSAGITLNMTTETPAGTYYFSVTIDSTESTRAALTVAKAPVTNVVITLTAPEGGVALATSATISSTTPASAVTPGNVTWSPSDTTAAYNTAYTATVIINAGANFTLANLTEQTEQQVTINGVTASVTNLTEGSATITCTFAATGSAPDTTAPTVSSISPEGSAAKAPLSGSITIVFSEGIRLSSGAGSELADGAFSWTSLAANLAGFQFGTTSGGNESAALITGASYTAETNTLTLTYSGLANNTPYYLTIYGVYDLAENALAQVIKEFTTAGATDPTVSVGTQVTALTYGTSGSTNYTVNTANIADGKKATVNWTGGAPSGVTDNTESASVSGGSLTLILTSDGTTPAGDYSFTVTIDGTTSSAVAFAIGKAAITSANIDLAAPTAPNALDTSAAITTTPVSAVSSATVTPSWSVLSGGGGTTTAGYATVYKATVTISAATGYSLAGLTEEKVTAGGVDTGYNSNDFTAGKKVTSATESSATIELVFPVTGEDPYPEMWIIGLNSNWTEPGQAMTKNSNTFTYSTVLTGDQWFRFPLQDTSSWGSDKDRPKRFQPAADNTVVSAGTSSIDMTYVANNEGTAYAWKLSCAPGTYTFTVNPYAGTFQISVSLLTVLSPPSDLALSTEGQATWTKLTDETYVTGYEVQIWKGGTSNTREGAFIHVAQGTGLVSSTYTLDLLNTLRNLTADSYYGISIKAIGDNTHTYESAETANDVAACWIELVPKVVWTWWESSDNTTARWNKVGSYDTYSLTFYIGGEAQEGSVTVTSANSYYEEGKPELKYYYEFTAQMSEPGIYQFSVEPSKAGRIIRQEAAVLSDVCIPKLPQLATPTLDTQSFIDGTWIAKWDQINGDIGVASYKVQIWSGSGGDHVIETRTITPGTGLSDTTYSLDLVTYIEGQSTDVWYAFDVQAIGNNTTHRSSATTNAEGWTENK